MYRYVSSSKERVVCVEDSVAEKLVGKRRRRNRSSLSSVILKHFLLVYEYKCNAINSGTRGHR